MSDELPVRTVGPLCNPCGHNVHEACLGCRGCGCRKSAVAAAAAGPKLPDPMKYKGAP